MDSSSTETLREDAPLDFIRDIVTDDGEGGQARRPRRDPLSARAERLPAHRPRQVDLPQLRRRRASSAARATSASTTPIPTKEDVEYVESIKDDVRWLGFDWDERLFYASDYFEQLYECAEQLIEQGKAYVDSLTAERDPRAPRHADRAGHGQPVPRPQRSRRTSTSSARMRAGEFPDGAHVLRAKIDMASPNINMRDPVLYRIRHAHHHRTGDAWCIYPMYDFAHRRRTRIEGITHSLCTLEFENHRPLYDWLIDNAAGAVDSRSRSSSRG